MSISMVAEKKTPTEIRMRAAMSARIQMMLKRHPKITTYYKLEAAAKVSSTCLRNMRDGNKQNIYGLSLTNAYKIATALDISLAELVSSPEEFFDKAQVPLPQSIEDLRECIADKLRMLMYSRTETNTSRKLTIASGVDERAIRRALGKADDYVPTLTTMAGLADFFQVPLSAFFIPPIGEVGVDEPPRASEMFSIEVLKSRLRASRAGAGLKIGEMAEKLNVKSEKISRWEALEKPRYSPTMVELQEWARITNRKLQWFIAEEAPSQGVAPDTALLRLTEENRWFVNEITTLLINHDVPGEALEATLRLLSTFPRSADAK